MVADYDEGGTKAVGILNKRESRLSAGIFMLVSLLMLLLFLDELTNGHVLNETKAITNCGMDVSDDDDVNAGNIQDNESSSPNSTTIIDDRETTSTDSTIDRNRQKQIPTIRNNICNYSQNSQIDALSTQPILQTSTSNIPTTNINSLPIGYRVPPPQQQQILYSNFDGGEPTNKRTRLDGQQMFARMQSNVCCCV